MSPRFDHGCKYQYDIQSCSEFAPRLDIDHHLINIQQHPNLVLINCLSRSTQLDFLLAIKVVAGYWSTPDRYPVSPTYWCDRPYGRIPTSRHTFVSAVGYSYLLVSLAPRLDIDHHLINIQQHPNLVLINCLSRSTQLDFFAGYQSGGWILTNTWSWSISSKSHVMTDHMVGMSQGSIPGWVSRQGSR